MKTPLGTSTSCTSSTKHKSAPRATIRDDDMTTIRSKSKPNCRTRLSQEDSARWPRVIKETNSLVRPYYSLLYGFKCGGF